jgi:hypothetical protein
MPQVPVLDHVALLVRSAASAAALCGTHGFELGPTEDFPGEGTREVYVGPPDAAGKLLLMEAIGPGPYRSALEKRGPGLHHVAVHVASIDEYIAGLTGSGWLLHPSSVHMLAHRKTAYLARPGLAVLIEVQQTQQARAGGKAFIGEVAIVGESLHGRLLDALGVQGLSIAGKDGASITIGGKRYMVEDLARS